MTRIAIGGFQHETNTFGLTTARMREFEIADSWPGMLLGDEVISGTVGLNLPIAGFVSEAQRNPDIELLPILWCAAEPCSYVKDDAFDQITSRMIDKIRQFGSIDGLYLDLHGAMVTQSCEDGEAEFLRRLRSEFGNDLPIALSLDLHANISAQLVELADSIDIFRTYPHLDMATTGARCVSHLLNQIERAIPFKAFGQVPYLIPAHAQNTAAEPCQTLYRDLEKRHNQQGVSASIALGFTASDIKDAGPSVVVYADKQDKANDIADQIFGELMKAEDQFNCELLSPQAAVGLAMQNKSDKPVVIADVQDNPGAGATSDTTGLLNALVEANAIGAVLGLMHDPNMAALAHDKGIGSRIKGLLGGRSGLEGQVPFEGEFRVEALSDGRCKYTGEMYGGGIADLGPCAVLKVLNTEGDIRVVISSNRSQCLDRSIFNHIGVDLGTCRIICVKSTVHYRADFEPIASEILEVAAPGLFLCDVEKINYTHLRKGMRLGPCGEAFDPNASTGRTV